MTQPYLLLALAPMVTLILKRFKPIFRYHEHEVEEDIPECRDETEQKCQQVSNVLRSSVIIVERMQLSYLLQNIYKLET